MNSVSTLSFIKATTHDSRDPYCLNGGNMKARPVIWNGKQYKSIAEAADDLGITADGLRIRLKKGYACDEDMKRPNLPSKNHDLGRRGIRRYLGSGTANRVSFQSYAATRGTRLYQQRGSESREVKSTFNPMCLERETIRVPERSSAG